MGPTHTERAMALSVWVPPIPKGPWPFPRCFFHYNRGPAPRTRGGANFGVFLFCPLPSPWGKVAFAEQMADEGAEGRTAHLPRGHPHQSRLTARQLPPGGGSHDGVPAARPLPPQCAHRGTSPTGGGFGAARPSPPCQRGVARRAGGILSSKEFVVNGIPQSPPGGGDSPLSQGGRGRTRRSAPTGDNGPEFS